jgi:Kef-type K+ transport system membrane component KefB
MSAHPDSSTGMGVSPAGQPRRHRLRRVAAPVALAVSLVASGTVIWRGGSGFGPTDPVAHFLLALAVIVALSHLFGAGMPKLGQPRVIGEIVSGLLLGPSALGALSPGLRAWLFPAETVDALGMAAQLGLVIFVFLLGCDLDIGQARRQRRVVGFVAAGAIVPPFLGGVGIAALAHPSMAGSAAGPISYPVFVGLAMSITALPVLARILLDWGIGDTRAGTVSLAAATIGDGLAWAALTLILATTRDKGGGLAITTIVLVGALVVVTAAGVRPALSRLLWWVQRSATSQRLALPILLAGLAGFASVTQLIGLHPVIGAFLFGLAVPRRIPAVIEAGRQLSAFAVPVLLPVFFAGVGLSTSVGTLGSSAASWSLFGAALLVATVTKFSGAAGGARLAGLSTRDCMQVGALMNCRGVTEITVAAVGLQNRIISVSGFTILVLLAVITTAATVPLVRVFSPVGPAPQVASAE